MPTPYNIHESVNLLSQVLNNHSISVVDTKSCQLLLDSMTPYWPKIHKTKVPILTYSRNCSLHIRRSPFTSLCNYLFNSQPTYQDMESEFSKPSHFWLSNIHFETRCDVCERQELQQMQTAAFIHHMVEQRAVQYMIK